MEERLFQLTDWRPININRPTKGNNKSTRLLIVTGKTDLLRYFNFESDFNPGIDKIKFIILFTIWVFETPNGIIIEYANFKLCYNRILGWSDCRAEIRKGDLFLKFN